MKKIIAISLLLFCANAFAESCEVEQFESCDRDSDGFLTCRTEGIYTCRPDEEVNPDETRSPYWGDCDGKGRKECSWTLKDGRNVEVCQYVCD